MDRLKTLHLPAPAKLNLFLHITGQRDDGYHLLQSVFQFLDYGDELSFTIRDDGVIHRVYELAGVAAADDLIIRAANLLQEASGTRFGVDIDLHKRLPMGGGLGGGSSDAATVLVGLNRLWQLGWERPALAELGLRLGADVPVFVHGHSAWAEGVGEQLVDIEIPEPWYVVIVPQVSVSTAKIFSDSTLRRDAAAITIRDFLAGAVVTNMLQPVVTRHYAEVRDALDWLAAYRDKARMTGSGACVFAACADEQQGRDILAAMPEGWQGFVARGCNESPLYTALGQ